MVYRASLILWMGVNMYSVVHVAVCLFLLAVVDLQSSFQTATRQH